jgi:hypothetical protein
VEGGQEGMKYTVMKCPCCGKEFVSEYWGGGYIDHVTNFVGNRDVFVRKNDPVEMASEIIFDGNNLRELSTIKDFLKCFMTWNCFPEEFKKRVKAIVDEFVKKYKAAQKRCDEIRKKESAIVVAILEGEDIDDAYFDLFDECCDGG